MHDRPCLPRWITALALITFVPTLLQAGCDKQEPSSSAADSATVADSAAPADASNAAPSSSSTEQDAVVEELILQELTFASAVEAKEPKDVLVAAAPGERVWAHLRLRYRGDATRKIHLEFRVNDDQRTTLDLEVTKSWSYRTWAYNTLLPTDKKGTVSLKVTDDSGAVLADTSVPIAGKVLTKPYVKLSK